MTPLNKALLAILIGGGLNVAFAAPAIVCPQQQQEGARTGRLNSADLFDGPPENLADLIPDAESWEWDLPVYQKRAKARGESLYFVCSYKGINVSVTLKIPYTARSCKVQGIKNGTYAACK